MLAGGCIHRFKGPCWAAEEGYSLEYLRVPVTDEKAPKERDFVVLQRRIWDKPPDTALIFNCQMGRGRTTTGMIIGSLLLLRQHTSSLPSASQGKNLQALVSCCSRVSLSSLHDPLLGP